MSALTRVKGMLWACALALVCGQVLASQDVPSSTPLHFGILPIGSAAESLTQWRPVLKDLQKHIDQPVTTVSVGSYASLSNAIGEQKVDVAFLSGKLAVQAVTQQHMRVFAQFIRSDGGRGNVALLVIRDDSEIHDLDGLLAGKGRWKYARSEQLSVSGYTAPEAYVFAPRGLNSDTFFATVRVGDHQSNLLAVVNREMDVTSSNNPDLDLFRRHFPTEAKALKVIWRSPSIPSGVLVVRQDMSPALRLRLSEFLLGYGKSPGEEGRRQREVLSRIPDLGGFAVETNLVLKPFIDMQHTLLRQQAVHGRWMSTKAQQARLNEIDRAYQRELEALLPSSE